MPTLAFVLDFIPNGCRASDDFLLAHAAALRARGWSAVYVFSGAPTSASFSASLGDLGVPWLVAPSKPSVSQAIAIGCKLRNYQPDILQTQFMSKFHPNIPALKIASGARYWIASDHSSGAVRQKSLPGRILSRMRGFITGIYVDRVITVSDFVRRRDVYELSLPENKMRLVYNGIDVDRFSCDRTKVHPTPTVAFAGQLIPEKGLMTLLRAMKRLVNEGLSIVLRIAGTGPQETALREYCKDQRLNGMVEFLGQINWIPDLFSQADVVVVPSEWEEAFGYVVAEAMASGAYVIGSDAGGISEVIGEGGATGLIFRKGDPVDLANKIRYVLSCEEQHRSAIRKAARERVEQLFSIDRMAYGYIDIYDELVPTRGNGSKVSLKPRNTALSGPE